MKERRTALYDRSSFNRDIMEIYKVMKYRIYFFLIVFVFMIGGLWASPVKVIVRQPVLPVLTLKEANPVLRLEFVKQASGDCAVREIVCSLKGSTDLTDIEHIRLYASAADGTLSVEHPLTLPMQVSEKVSFKEPLVLKDGRSFPSSKGRYQSCMPLSDSSHTAKPLCKRNPGSERKGFFFADERMQRPFFPFCVLSSMQRSKRSVEYPFPLKEPDTHRQSIYI